MNPLVIVIVVLVVAFGGYVIWNETNNKEQDSQSQVNLPDVASDVKSIGEIEEALALDKQVTILSYVQENKDGIKVYVIALSDGRKLIVNASSGEIISEEKTDSPDENEDQVKINVSLDEARKTAESLSSSPVKKIELETEDTKATYKVEFVDGSKVEIDATSGEVNKSEIKNES